MADEAVPRDRQIRTEAMHMATRIAAAAVGNNEQFHIGEAAHTYAHYIHAGIWLDVREGCPFGDDCRFNRKVEW